MFNLALRFALCGLAAGLVPLASANAAEQAGKPVHQSGQQTKAQNAPVEVIDLNKYARLEVTLRLSGNDKVLRFDRVCPERSLWDIDLKSLLAGSDHATLGISIEGPGIGKFSVTPVVIDVARRNILGIARSCSVTVDQINYLSPILFVKRHNGDQLTISPTYSRAKAVNPGVIDTVENALSLALSLSKIPGEAAAPFQQSVRNILGGISTSDTVTLIKHPVIAPGPVPPIDSFQWVAENVLPAQGGRAAANLVLTARLVPVEHIVADPPNGIDGQPVWTVTDVLSSAFADRLAPGFNQSGTLGGFVESSDPTNLSNLRTAASKEAAGYACDALKSSLGKVGFSDRDFALLMWAITHERAPSGTMTRGEVDSLYCLEDSWRYLPDPVKKTRVSAEVKRPAAAPPTRAMMSDVRDVFERFFTTGTWTSRRDAAARLFAYPVLFNDGDRLTMTGSATLANADQWLALHTVPGPLVAQFGCVTYVPATDDKGTSLMYAVATLPAGQPDAPVRQVLLSATFANMAPNAEARVAQLEVLPTAAESVRKAIRDAAADGQCLGGYKPALIFGS